MDENRYDNGQELDDILKASGKILPQVKRNRLDEYPRTKDIELPCERDGFTPLTRATIAGDLEVVQVLLSNGADPNIANPKKGRTPMHYAAREGFIHIATELINYGGDVNIQDHNGHTPLMYATEKRNLKATSFFIENGANLNLKDNHGNTALLYAIKNADKDIMTHLIMSGSDMDTQNNKGFSASFLKEKIINLHEQKLGQIAQKQNAKNLNHPNDKALSHKRHLSALDSIDVASKPNTIKTTSTKFRDIVTKSKTTRSTHTRGD